MSNCDKSMAAHMNGGLRGKEMEGENIAMMWKDKDTKRMSFCKGKR